MKPHSVFDALTKHVKSEHPVYKLGDVAYEALREKAMDDQEMQDQYIECHAEEIELWLNERGIHHDYHCDHEFEYIESHEEDYLQFAYDRYLDEAMK